MAELLPFRHAAVMARSVWVICRGSKRCRTVAYRASAKNCRAVKEGYCAGRRRWQSRCDGYGLIDGGWIHRRRQHNSRSRFANNLRSCAGCRVIIRISAKGGSNRIASYRQGRRRDGNCAGCRIDRCRCPGSFRHLSPLRFQSCLEAGLSLL